MWPMHAACSMRVSCVCAEARLLRLREPPKRHALSLPAFPSKPTDALTAKRHALSPSPPYPSKPTDHETMITTRQYLASEGFLQFLDWFDDR